MHILIYFCLIIKTQISQIILKNHHYSLLIFQCLVFVSKQTVCLGLSLACFTLPSSNKTWLNTGQIWQNIPNWNSLYNCKTTIAKESYLSVIALQCKKQLRKRILHKHLLRNILPAMPNSSMPAKVLSASTGQILFLMKWSKPWNCLPRS